MKMQSRSTAQKLRLHPMECSKWYGSRVAILAQSMKQTSNNRMVYGQLIDTKGDTSLKAERNGLGRLVGKRRADDCEVEVEILDSIVTYLIFEGSGTEVTERQLETAGTALVVDLEGDEDVRSGLGG